jgi:hypothetical protein
MDTRFNIFIVLLKATTNLSEEIIFKEKCSSFLEAKVAQISDASADKNMIYFMTLHMNIHRQSQQKNEL